MDNQKENLDAINRIEFTCEWYNCTGPRKFQDLTSFLAHLRQHSSNVHLNEDNKIVCLWSDCLEEFDPVKIKEFQLHLNYHGYHTKLMCLGECEIKKISLQIKREVSCNIDPSARTILPVLPDSFICGWKDCFRVFYDAEEFYRHVEEHPTKDIQIPKDIPKSELKKTKFAICEWNDCQFSSNSRWHLKDHLRSHTQEKVVACPNCGSMFCSKFKLGDHILRQYINENFTNEHLRTLLLHVSNGESQVTLTLIQNRQLNGEENAMASENKSSAILPCIVDDNNLNSISATSSSIFQRQKHFDEQETLNAFSSALGEFKCDNCEIICATKSLLREHTKSHFESYAYQCDLCSFKAPSPSGILHHKKYRHSDERPFNCQFCEAKFKSKSDLRKHIDTHSSEFPFKCGLCSFECRCQHTLSRHHKHVHENKKQMYACHMCFKSFTRGNNLSRHLIKYHDLSIPVGKTRFVYRRDADGLFRVTL